MDDEPAGHTWHEIVRDVLKRHQVKLVAYVPDNVLRPLIEGVHADPFFTAFDVSCHSSGTFEFDKRGLGLGLSVAKAFVEMHGGTLTVESVLQQGTTFTMELPV